MRLHLFYAILAHVSLSTAVKLTYTGGNYNNVVAGEPFVITWKDASGSVTIILNSGLVSLTAVESIVSGATGTSYTWTPSSALPQDVYTIEIEDDSTSMDYSVGFEIKSGSNVQPSSTAVAETTSVGTAESSSTANGVSSAATQPPAQTITQTIMPTSTEESFPSTASPTSSLSESPLSSHSSTTSSSQSLSTTSQSTSTSSQSSSSTSTSQSQSSSSSSQSLITSTQSSGSTLTSTSATNSSQSPTPTSQSTPNTHKGLSTGAKAGIGVGVILGLVLIGIVFWFGRKSAHSKRAGTLDPPVGIELGAGIRRRNRAEMEAPLNEEERVELESRRRAAELAGMPNLPMQPVADGSVNAERAELEALRRSRIYEM